MVKVDAEQAVQWPNRQWKCVNPKSDEEADDTRLGEILLVATTSQVRPRSTDKST